MAMTLQEGDPAPNFTLPRDGGGEISLSALRGRKVVLYAYPKDNTPACTEEAIAFNRLRREFTACGTEIIGVSPDLAKKHGNFKRKYELDFPCLQTRRKRWRTPMAYGSRRASMAASIWGSNGRPS